MAYNRRYQATNNKCKLEGCELIRGTSFGGYCWKHEKLDPAYERKQARQAMKADMQKIKKLINSIDDKLVDNTAAREFQLLQNFFREVALEIDKNPVCWECGGFIKPKYYRAATAHICAKAIFPSIAAHPMNYLILCASNGCHDKTHRMDTFSKMNIFPEAIRRFRLFYPEIREAHKLRNEFIYYSNNSPIEIPIFTPKIYL